jgi:hypothetical protein
MLELTVDALELCLDTAALVDVERDSDGDGKGMDGVSNFKLELADNEWGRDGDLGKIPR